MLKQFDAHLMSFGGFGAFGEDNKKGKKHEQDEELRDQVWHFAQDKNFTESTTHIMRHIPTESIQILHKDAPKHEEEEKEKGGKLMRLLKNHTGKISSEAIPKTHRSTIGEKT